VTGAKDRTSGLTAAHLRRVLRYNPKTGVFTWRVKIAQWCWLGARAGTINTNGRRQIAIGGRRFLAARLAVLYVRGRWPHDEIDHRNCRKADDRWANLRETARPGNARNRFVRRDSLSGAKGVHFRRATGRYEAYVGKGGNCRHLGTFATKAAAARAYRAEARRLYGKFARS
jgi:hypothetical protein